MLLCVRLSLTVTQGLDSIGLHRSAAQRRMQIESASKKLTRTCIPCLSEGLIKSSGATALVRISPRAVARGWSATGRITGAQDQNVNLVFEIAARCIVSRHAIYTATPYARKLQAWLEHVQG